MKVGELKGQRNSADGRDPNNDSDDTDDTPV